MYSNNSYWQCCKIMKPSIVYALLLDESTYIGVEKRLCVCGMLKMVAETIINIAKSGTLYDVCACSLFYFWLTVVSINNNGACLLR